MNREDAVEVLEAVSTGASKLIEFVYPGFVEAIGLAVEALKGDG